MLDSARASLRCGLDHYLRFGGTDEEALRQTAIDLHGGIELLLKERIRRAQPLLLFEKVDAALVLDHHVRAKKGMDVTPERSVAFNTATERAMQLSTAPDIYRRELKGLNTLRNDLVHLGDTQMPVATQIALVRDALRFVQAFVQTELAVNTEDFLGSERWLPVASILESEDKEGEQRLQSLLQRHRDRHRSFSPVELARLRRVSPDVNEPTISLDCPACGELAAAQLLETPDFDEEGFAGVVVSVEKIACAVCGLTLTEEPDLQRFQHLAERYVQEQAEDAQLWSDYIDEDPGELGPMA